VADEMTGLPASDPTVLRVAWYRRKRVLVPAAVVVLTVMTVAAGAVDPGSVADAPSKTATEAASEAAQTIDDTGASAAASDAALAEQVSADEAVRQAAAAEAAAKQAAAATQAEDAAAAEAAAAAAAAEQAATDAAVQRTAATWTVMDVVDGDTVDVRQGGLTQRVRIIGIDTPERGECGYEQAADVLAGHVLGLDVVLVSGAREDRDSYDRVLRYVDRASDGLDAGRSLLDAGLAIARYDSRDGYGGHLREVDYVATDAATPVTAVCPAAPPPPPPAAPLAPVPLVGARAGCDPAYPTVCLPTSPDVDCGEISFRFFPTLPPDPHRLDGSDNDGIACESD